MELELVRKMKSIKLLTGGNFELLNNLDKFDIIIDGILGTGISGEIREPQASAITIYQQIKCIQTSCRCSFWCRSRYWKQKFTTCYS